MLCKVLQFLWVLVAKENTCIHILFLLIHGKTSDYKIVAQGLWNKTSFTKMCCSVIQGWVLHFLSHLAIREKLLHLNLISTVAQTLELWRIGIALFFVELFMIDERIEGNSFKLFFFRVQVMYGCREECYFQLSLNFIYIYSFCFNFVIIVHVSDFLSSLVSTIILRLNLL